MKFDTLSFLFGIVVAVIIGLVYTAFFVKKSFYDSMLFSDAMSMEEAQKLLDSETETMKNQYQQKEQNGTVSEEDKKKYQDDLIKLSTDFSAFMNKKSIQTAEAASPAPAPEAPSPVPEAPSPAPQTSTYEIEPYHG